MVPRARQPSGLTRARGWRRAWVAAALSFGLGAAQASLLQFCATPDTSTPAEKDRLFRLAAVVKARLDEAGAPAALIARSGMDLGRLNLRYSHAGVALRDNPQGPWAVRQLYFACDESRPRVYDQGVAGFILGMDQPRVGYIRVVLLPADAADTLARTALAREQALAVLNADYSANAYAWGLRYQNCNQWLAELLALAWSPTPLAAEGSSLRAAAQGWLKEAGYEPTTVQVPWRPMMWAGRLVPWLHDDDHPTEDLDAARYRVSLPDALDQFALKRWPGARQIEFCHREGQLVVRRAGPPLPEGCQAEAGDELITLD